MKEQSYEEAQQQVSAAKDVLINAMKNIMSRTELDEFIAYVSIVEERALSRLKREYVV